MKKFVKLCLFMITVAVMAVSIPGMQASAISNGSDAKKDHEYGAVSLWYPDSAGVNRHRCGAALISQFWAVTAAHCQGILVPNQTQVRVDGPNNNDPSQYQEVGLAQVIIHPDYYAPPDDAPSVNDIALIKFQRPATKPTTKLALPFNSPSVGTQGTVAGWGWICDDTVGQSGALPNCGLPYTNILQELALKVAPDSRCEYMGDAQTELCAVAASGKHAMACRGDSGSPVVRNFSQQWVLMGVVEGDGDNVINHANECDENVNGDQGTATLMDVSKYTEWIVRTIFGNISNKTAAEEAVQMPQVIKQSY